MMALLARFGLLGHYVRRVEAGERVAVTAHGRVVAELVLLGLSCHRVDH